MRKNTGRLHYLLTAATILILSGHSHVGATGSRGLVNVSFGGVSAIENFHKSYRGGLSVALDFESNTSDVAAFGVGIQYNRYGTDSVGTFTAGVLHNSRYGINVVGQLRYYFKNTRSPSRFYLKAQGGLGTLALSTKSDLRSVTESQSHATIAGGIGANFRGKKSTGGHIEILYNALFGEFVTGTYLSIRGGLTFFMLDSWSN